MKELDILIDKLSKQNYGNDEFVRFTEIWNGIPVV